MKVILDLENGICTVLREDGPKIYKETALFHAVKKELIKQGYNVIKKLMWKDGHLVDDNRYYIRERKGKFAIHDPQHSIRWTYRPYNKEGKVCLAVVS